MKHVVDLEETVHLKPPYFRGERVRMVLGEHTGAKSFCMIVVESYLGEKRPL